MTEKQDEEVKATRTRCGVDRRFSFWSKEPKQKKEKGVTLRSKAGDERCALVAHTRERHTRETNVGPILRLFRSVAFGFFLGRAVHEMENTILSFSSSCCDTLQQSFLGCSQGYQITVVVILVKKVKQG